MRYRDKLFATGGNVSDSLAKIVFLAWHVLAGIDAIIIFAGFLVCTVVVVLAFTLKKIGKIKISLHFYVEHNLFKSVSKGVSFW